jgi:hypothetical protein
MSKSNEHLCGLNVLRNMFGYEIVNIQQMNEAIDHFNMNKDNKVFGIHDVGQLHFHVVHFMFRKYGKCDLKNISQTELGNHVHDAFHLMNDPQRNFVVYGWDSTLQSGSVGHYVIVKEGFVIDDAYRKSGKVKVEVLSIKALKTSFYGSNTLLKVYLVTESRKTKVLFEIIIILL